MNLFAVHGILQLIAFGVLFPLGVLVALFREYVGPRWFILHMSLQSAATILMVIAITIAGFAGSSEKEHVEIHVPTHIIVGYTLVGLVCAQIIWAVFFRHTVNRPLWYVIHMCFAAAIIGLGWLNVYLGYRRYHEII